MIAQSRPPDPRQNRLIGRGCELRTLEAVVESARAGASRAVLVIGEAGIGKTRLLRELRRRATGAGFDVLDGRGAWFEREVPFGVVADALEERLEGGVSRTTGSKDYSHRAIRSALEELAERRPVLLAVDDLQWADPASVELIADLLGRRVGRFVLALAYRPHPLPPALATEIHAGLAAGTIVALGLRPLSSEQAADLLGSGRERAAVAGLVEQSRGNPFYLEQLSRALDAETDVGELPSAVRAAIVGELAALSPKARRLLEAGAVLGDAFEPGGAAAIASLDGRSARSALEELRTWDIVRIAQDCGQAEFRHPILRRAVYDGLPPGHRLRAHRHAARLIAASGAPVGVLAHHLERSAAVGDLDAVAVLADAGSAAAARDPASAARWYGAARRLLPDETGWERKLELLVAEAAALASIGKLSGSASALRTGLDLLPDAMAERRAGLIEMIARAEHGMGRPAEARRLLLEGLSEVGPDSRPSVPLLLCLAENRVMEGDWKHAATTAERARALAEMFGDRSAALVATASLARNAGWRGEKESALRAIAAVSEQLRGIPDDELTPVALDALVKIGSAEISVDLMADAAEHLERAVAASRVTGQGHVSLRCLLGLATARLLEGRLGEARALVEGAEESELLLGNERLLAQALAVKCCVATQQGDGSAALSSGLDAVRVAARAPRSMYSWLARVSYGEALLEFGEAESGREQILAAGGSELRDCPPTSRPFWSRVLIQAELVAGRVEAAERIASAAERVAHPIGVNSCLAEVRYGQACVLLAREDFAGAAAAASNAGARFRLAGWSVWEARARVQDGRALVADGRGDEARRELELAHRSFVQYGAARYADQAAAELRPLGSRVPGRSAARSDAAARVASLSGREHEVIDRVSRGYTNRQIAAELFVTDKTVEKHLARVFAKLGASTRAAAAAAFELAQ